MEKSNTYHGTENKNKKSSGSLEARGKSDGDGEIHSSGGEAVHR